MSPSHLDDTTLSRLLDGALPPDERERSIQHLATCARCRSAHDDAAHLIASGGAATPGGAPSLLLRDAGRVVGSVDAPRRRPRRHRRIAAPVALGVTGLAAIAALVLLPLDRPPGFEPPAALLAEVQIASSTGLVLPGGEDGADHPPPRLRGNGGLPAPSRELPPIGVDRSADGWRIAVDLARADVDAARQALEVARTHHRGSPLLTHLDAILAHRESRLDDSVRLLRTVLEQDPGNDGARLNLGLVLIETGHEAEGVAVLDTVAGGDSPALARRARAELGALGR